MSGMSSQQKSHTVTSPRITPHNPLPTLPPTPSIGTSHGGLCVVDGVWRLPLYLPGIPSRYLSTLVCTYSVYVAVITVISGPILKLSGKYAHHEVTQV